MSVLLHISSAFTSPVITWWWRSFSLWRWNYHANEGRFPSQSDLVYRSASFALNSSISKASIRPLTTLVPNILANISSFLFSDSTLGRFLRTLSSTGFVYNNSVADGKAIQVSFDILFTIWSDNLKGVL